MDKHMDQLEILKKLSYQYGIKVQYFMQFADIAEVIFLSLDDRGVITFINKYGLELLGYSRDELLGRNWFRLCLPPPIRETMQSVYDNLMQGKLERVENFNNSVLCRDGTERTIAWHNALITNKENRVVGTMSSGEDITDTLALRHDLSEAYDIISNSPAVAFKWKNQAGWPVEYVSSNTTALFGYDKDAFSSGSISYAKTIHPDDLDRVISEVSKHSNDPHCDRVTHLPYRIITKGGEIKWVDDKTVIVRDEKGTVTHYKGIVLDITARVEVSQALEKEKRTLEEALEKVKKLSGLVPICSYCKSIRGDSGYWSDLEEYLSENSEAELSHGICPSCTSRYFPDFDP